MEPFDSVCKLPRKPWELCLSQGFKEEILRENARHRVLHSTRRATHQFMGRYGPNVGDLSLSMFENNVRNGLYFDRNVSHHPQEDDSESFKDLFYMESIPQTGNAELMSPAGGMEKTLGNISQIGDVENAVEYKAGSMKKALESIPQIEDVENAVGSISKTANLENVIRNLAPPGDMEFISHTGDMPNDDENMPQTGEMESTMENILQIEDTEVSVENISQTGGMESIMGSISQTGESMEIFESCAVAVINYMCMENISETGNLKNVIGNMTPIGDMKSISQTGDTPHDVENIPKIADMESAMENISQIQDTEKSMENILQRGVMENVMVSISQTEDSMKVSGSCAVAVINYMSMENGMESSSQQECECLDMNSINRGLNAKISISLAGNSNQVLESCAATLIDPLSVESVMEYCPQTDIVPLMEPLSMENAMETIPQTCESQKVSLVDSLSVENSKESITRTGQSPKSFESATEVICQTGESQRVSLVDLLSVENAMEIIAQPRKSQDVSVVNPFLMENTTEITGESQQISLIKPFFMENGVENIPQREKPQQTCEYLHESKTNKSLVLRGCLQDMFIAMSSESSVKETQIDLKSVQVCNIDDEDVLASNPIQEPLINGDRISHEFKSRSHPQNASLCPSQSVPHDCEIMHLNSHALNIPDAIADHDIVSDHLSHSDDFHLKSPEAPTTPDLYPEDRSWPYCSDVDSPFSGRGEEEHENVCVEECDKEQGREIIASYVDQSEELENEGVCGGEENDKEREQKGMLIDNVMGQYIMADLLHEKIASEKEIEVESERERKGMPHTLMKQSESNDACDYHAHKEYSLRPRNQKRLRNHVVQKVVYFSKLINLNMSTAIKNGNLISTAKYICRSKLLLKKLLRIIKTDRHSDLWKQSCRKIQTYLDGNREKIVLDEGQRVSTDGQIVDAVCDLDALMSSGSISVKKGWRDVKHFPKKVNWKKIIIMVYLCRRAYLTRKIYVNSKICGDYVDDMVASLTGDNKSPVKLPETNVKQMVNVNDSFNGIECFEKSPEQWNDKNQSPNKIEEEEDWNDIHIDNLEECLDTCLQDLCPQPLSFPAATLSPYPKVSNSSLNKIEQTENLSVLSDLDVDNCKLPHSHQIDAMQSLASQEQAREHCNSSSTSSSQSEDMAASLSSIQMLSQNPVLSSHSSRNSSPQSPNSSKLGAEFTRAAVVSGKMMNEMKNKEKLKQCAEVFLLRRHIIQQQRRAQRAPPYPFQSSVGSGEGSDRKLTLDVDNAYNTELTNHQESYLQRSIEPFGSNKGSDRKLIIDVDSECHINLTNHQENCLQSPVEPYGSSKCSDMRLMVDVDNACHIKHANHRETSCSGDVVIDIEELQKYVGVQFISQVGMCIEEATNVVIPGTINSSNQSIVIPNVAAVVVTIVAMVVYTRILCDKALARVGLRSRSKEQN